jgi:hypothetical protein
MAACIALWLALGLSLFCLWMIGVMIALSVERQAQCWEELRDLLIEHSKEGA